MILTSAFVFLFGLIVGSFLNVVIYRLSFDSVQGKKSALRGRSFCPHCKHTLAWHDLVPVVSFVLLGGRCRYCGKQISWQYPLVELATAALFLLSFKLQASSLNQVSSIEILSTLYLWIIASLLVVLFVYDLRHYILPDKILFPAIGLVVGYHLFVLLSRNWDLSASWRIEIRNLDTLVNLLLAGILASAFFLAIFLLSRGRAMGFGDVKLALFMGLFLGWPNILVALFVAFLLGGIIGVLLIVLRKKGLKSEIPFGPFLITGTFVALFWGTIISDWYLNLFYVF